MATRTLYHDPLRACMHAENTHIFAAAIFDGFQELVIVSKLGAVYMSRASPDNRADLFD